MDMPSVFYGIGFAAPALIVVALLWKSRAGKAARKWGGDRRKARKAAERVALRAADAATKQAEKDKVKAEREASTGTKGKRKPVTAEPAPEAPAEPAPAPQLGGFYRGVYLTGKAVRAGAHGSAWTARKVAAGHNAAADRFTTWAHPPVASWLRSKGWARLADRLHKTPDTPANAPQAPAAPTVSTAPPAARPLDPNTQLFGGTHTMGDILVPDKRCQAAMEALAVLTDFAPAKEGGAWELERFLQSLPEVTRAFSTAIAFVTSTLDGQKWDPEVVRKLYAGSASIAGAIPVFMDAWEALREVYNIDFQAAETGGRRRVEDHQQVFNPEYATTG